MDKMIQILESANFLIESMISHRLQHNYDKKLHEAKKHIIWYSAGSAGDEHSLMKDNIFLSLSTNGSLWYPRWQVIIWIPTSKLSQSLIHFFIESFEPWDKSHPLPHLALPHTRKRKKKEEFKFSYINLESFTMSKHPSTSIKSNLHEQYAPTCAKSLKEYDAKWRREVDRTSRTGSGWELKGRISCLPILYYGIGWSLISWIGWLWCSHFCPSYP